MGVRRVSVTGSRTWTDAATIRAALAGQWGRGTRCWLAGSLVYPADLHLPVS